MIQSTRLYNIHSQFLKFGKKLGYFTQTLLIIFSALLLAQPMSAQAPCNAHRWNAGDGWRFVNNKWEAVTLNSPNLQPKGIIRCASSAETESGLTAYKGSYNPDIFPINTSLTGCFNQQTGIRGITVTGPTNGEDIVWFNFDIRPLAGTYQFQIVSNQVVGWVLYYSKEYQPTTATGTTYPSTPTGLSGNCSPITALQYADCGLSGNGWSTIKVPSFTQPTNYYLAMWIADGGTGVGKSTFPGSMNLTYKARYGCGGSTCFLEKSGSPALTCTSSGYEVCQTFNGSAGKWLVEDLATTKATSYTVTTYDQNGNVVTTESSTNLATKALYVELGTITGNSPQNDIKAKVCATYANGVTYNIKLTPSGVPAGAPNDYVDCNSTETFTGSGLSALAPTATPTHPICGQTNGSVSIDNYDATITYVLKQGTEVKYSNPNSSGVFANVAPGTYTIEASKTSSCTGTGSVTVNSAPSNLSTPTATPTHPVCGQTNGSVQVNNFSSADGITYELKQSGELKYTANSTTGVFSSVAPGTYDLVASKTGSCTATGSVVVNSAPPNLTTPSGTPTNPICGQTNGSVQVNNFSSADGITYVLKLNNQVQYTAGNTGLFSNVAPNTYVLEASKIGSCTATGSVTVNSAPSDLGTPTATPTDPGCGQTNGSVAINNYDATITYVLKQNSVEQYNSPSSLGVFANVTPGTYTIEASKTGSCTTTGSVTVAAAPKVPDQPTVCVVQPSLCGPAKGIISITPVTGNTYSIDGEHFFTNSVFCNLDAGLNPTIVVRSSDGCPSDPISCKDVAQCTTTPTCPSEELFTNSISSQRSSISSKEQSVSIKLESQKTKVIAAPNPFYNKVRFTLQSEVSGQGSLEIYNMLGQKVKTIFQGYVQKGQVQNFEYNASGTGAQHSSLIYIFKVGGQQVTGKLIGLK